ncbi:MAG: cytotoxic translational repressor of toxin-antitoxin stability system [Deltaproteobacteria bacterium RIFOXYD12_FULL_56_24]|nr:MAG: cytotoxic translational repressor of toxin-antitoxin stability system [Deltaproteobacteria bacterium RIFOXYD12_FULL_56_24]
MAISFIDIMLAVSYSYEKITYSRGAVKTLSLMPADTACLIRVKIEQYAADPASMANNIKALQGVTGYFRLRIGDWRVICSGPVESQNII